jgi:DNA polymerase
VLFVLSQLVRTAFIPTPGNRFPVADFSAIEVRVVAWLAGKRWALDEFKGDRLIYEATTSATYHVPKLDIKKGGLHPDLRPRGKTATLACGYQGGPAALIRMGTLRDGIPEDELPGIVARWRKADYHSARRL